MNRRPQQFRRDPRRLLSRAAGRRSRPSRRARSPFREEFTSKVWATGLQFPGDRPTGKVIKTIVPGREAPGVPGAGSSTRGGRKFADPRTRQAIGLAFDFEWTNRNLFFDAYERDLLLFRELGLRRRRACRRRRSWRCSSRSAPSCRRRCSASPMCRRSPTARAATASCSARRPSCWRRPAGSPSGDQLIARRRAARRSSS